MDTRFECIFEGKRIFQVFRSGADAALFTGTRAQCQRFLEVYTEKVQKARNRDRSRSGESSSLA
ncbi:MAG: hypothetical protein EXS14_08905 [Planctomycetes bacterium]|nr:hypothetical protein [Planctomycetota bacterium]